MLSDPIADALTRIRNAQMVKKTTVLVTFSKTNEAILTILKEQGYIKKFALSSDKLSIEVSLQYDKKGVPKIKHLKRISKPGKKIYTKSVKIPSVLNDYGIALISTNKGIITNKQAREMKLGGEILCEVY
jgi:small subunit ribosomal protein S8